MAAVREHVWKLLSARPGGFPWLGVAGKLLTGWVVIDLDATLITAHSDKAGAAPTFKKGFGFHPLAAWCANTHECLTMLLRPGNAGSNTVADHLKVLADAIAQIPPDRRAKILVRVDGAGATHELLEHLRSLNTNRRTVRYTVGLDHHRRRRGRHRRPARDPRGATRSTRTAPPAATRTSPS